MRTALRILLGVLAAILVVVLLAILVFTNTSWGRERVRRFAVKALNESAHGIVRVGNVRGNLLSGIVLSDLSITDSAGNPFLAVDRARAQYAVRTFLSKKIVLTSLALEHPVVVLNHPPGGEWNFERIFPTKPKQPNQPPGFGSWITLDNVRITDGRVVVRMPWAPSDSLRAAERDSVIRAALGGDTRARVERVAGGFQTVMDYRDIQASLPHIRLADPDSGSRLIRVAALRMTALPFRPPAAEIRGLRGDFHLDGDSLWFRALAVSLPHSRMRGDGTYLLGPGDMRLSLRAAPVALGDIRFMYPSLPSSGRGSLGLTMLYRAKGESDYQVRDAHVTIDSASLDGSVGISTGTGDGPIRVHDTSLRFARVDTRLIEQLAPRLKSPRRGTLSGRATLSGTPTAMRVDADVAFDAARGGTSHVVAVGGVGVGEGVRLDDLRLRLEPLQVDLARAVSPSLPVRGTITGTVRVDGSTLGRLVASADLVHRDRGAVSRVSGRGTATLRGRKWVDADIRLAPLSLVTAGRFAPALRLHGTAAGRLRVTGALSMLRVNGDLRLPDGGTLVANGWADVESPVKRYDVGTELRLFDLRSVTERGPRTSVTAVARATGYGTKPATMRATFAADVSRSSVDSIPFDTLHVRVAVGDGMARIDSMSFTAPTVRARANGTFGLAPGRHGTLTYAVEIDSLSSLRRLLPVDTGAVPPRPGRVAAALARARADSARTAEATAVERAATGAPAPVLHVDSVRAIARDSVAGAVYTAGTVRGGLDGFDVRGRLAARAVVARGSAVKRARVEYAWNDARTPGSAIAVGLALDTVVAAGFALDSVEVRAAYRKPSATVQMAIYQDTAASYDLNSEIVLHPGRSELRLREVALRFDTTRWVSARSATVRWGENGVAIDTLDLRRGSAGRIFLNGAIPKRGDADVELEITGLDVANVVGLLQGDIVARGMLTASARLTGTRERPRLRAAASLTNASYRGAPLPAVRATVAYADTRLTASADLRRGMGLPLATIRADVPVNLAFAGVTGSRLLDRAMRVDFRADSLPLDALPKFTDAVADVRGRVIGLVAARGTPRHPSLAGRLAVDFASFRIVPMGVTLRQISGMVHMLGDSIVIDTLSGMSGGGVVALRGGVGIATLTRPSFALRATARDALVLDTEQGQLRADADIGVSGPFTDVAISGRARILNGAIYVPEASGGKVLALSDSAVSNVADTSAAATRELLPARSPLLQNMRVDIALGVSRDTWVRSQDANVEIYSTGDLAISVNQAKQALSLEGVVNTDRGEYAFMGRRFTLSQGSVTFTGDPDLNPLLQLTAVREVQLAGREALKIRIVIGGTMRQPKITLASDAQPPISQSDLLSYLAFGQSSSSLLQVGGSSGLGGQSTGTGELAGQAAGIATRQLAAVAVDVLAKQLQANAARSIGADVLDITPADIPTDFSLTGVETLLAGTQVQVGKYVNRRTFVVLQARPTFVAPGLSIEHRMPKGYRIEASIEPRFLLRQPTLSETPNPRATSVFGAFLIREWRF
ncbi:MAG TPA: translocation/assembly module TamB domain-containing protein [Gemmatimonadaceae bacterium]